VTQELVKLGWVLESLKNMVEDICLGDIDLVCLAVAGHQDPFIEDPPIRSARYGVDFLPMYYLDRFGVCR
jgi:hypothetical protein